LICASRVLAGLLIAAWALAAPTAASSSSAALPTYVSSSGATGWKPDARAARKYARKRAGNPAFAVVGLGGGMREFRAGRTAPLASVFKAMLLPAYLSRDGVRGDRLTSGERDLLGPMIRRSDDVAATEINNTLGAEPIKQLARKASLRHFSYDPATWGLSRGNPREFARFIYRIRRYVPRRHEGYALRLLSTITGSQRWGVGAAKPRGWRLYFKGGWGSGSGAVNHQIALLERGDCRIALAMFTTNSPNHDYGSRTLEGLANRLTDGLRRRSGC
jgi:hypothetical protein